MTENTSQQLSTAIALATNRAPGRLTDRLSAQLHRVTAANGKIIETLIGSLGANPRKGATHSRADLTRSLVDVAIQALTIIQMVELERRNRVGAGGALSSKLARVALRAGVAPETDEVNDDPLDYAWQCLLAISGWVDEKNRHRDQEAQLWGRVSKVAEELGEAAAALLALGDTNAPDTDAVGVFMEEVLDVAVAAFGAAEHVNGNNGRIHHQLIRTAQRLTEGRITGAQIREALLAPRCAFTHTVYPAGHR